MKSVGSFSKIAAFGVAFAALIVTSSANAAEGSALVRGVTGTAQNSVGGDWQTLKTGDMLRPGAVLQTGVGSQIDLSLGANGESVTLLENTTLRLTTLDVDRTGIETVFETFLDLSAGTIQGTVRKFSAASKYEVKTPHTVVGINGSEDCEYQISADGTTDIRKGAAVVAYTNPSSGQVQPPSTVGANQSFVPPVDPAITQNGEVRPGGFEPVPPSPGGLPPRPLAPVVTVPEPVPFVSPGTGKPVSSGGE